jgi:hypothetical protein
MTFSPAWWENKERGGAYETPSLFKGEAMGGKQVTEDYGGKVSTYENEIERCLVLIRLLCLGVMYREFCYFAWDEYPDINLADWADGAGINSFRIAQNQGHCFHVGVVGDEGQVGFGEAPGLEHKDRPFFGKFSPKK